MKLSQQQNDMLVEVCNIGMSKAAKQLSTLLTDSVEISIPKITISNTESASNYADLFHENSVGCINLSFTGEMAGIALLLFQQSNINFLTQQFSQNIAIQELNLADNELTKVTMEEIGNIIMSSCFTAFANFMDTHIKISVPAYMQGDPTMIINECYQNYTANGDDTDVIALTMNLKTKQHHVSGEFVILLTKESVQNILSTIMKRIQPN